jgi:beta-lactamase regulating signal transducer with metallopeptidase domain
MNEIINDLLIVLNNTGSGFCNHALSMFAQSAVLIILLLIIDFMLRKKVRAVFRYCVWMLVFIKLILPTTLSLPTGIGYWCGSSLSPKKLISIPITDSTSSPESTMSGISEHFAASAEPSLIHPSQAPPEKAAAITPVISKDSAITTDPHPHPPSESGTQIASAVTTLPPITWQAIVFLIWLVGALVFSVLLIQRMLFVLGLIAQSEPAKARLLETLKQCRQQVGIGRNIELKLSNNIQSPAVCGLVKPIILMPTSLLEELSNDKLRAVLIHELVHIKRFDLWINFAQTFLQIIYFYNPFVWFANAVVRRLREQAVDETVLVAMGTEAKSYSNTLIDIAEMAFFRTNFSLRLIGVAESKKSLHRRIRHMLSRPIPKSAKIGVLSLIALIALAAVLLPMAGRIRGAAIGESSVQDDSDTQLMLTESKTYRAYQVSADDLLELFTQNQNFGDVIFVSRVLQWLDPSPRYRRASSWADTDNLKHPVFVGYGTGAAGPYKMDIKTNAVLLDLEHERVSCTLNSGSSIQGSIFFKGTLDPDQALAYVAKMPEKDNSRPWHIVIYQAAEVSNERVSFVRSIQNAREWVKLEAKPVSSLPFMATLPNGVTVELAGVCDWPEKGKRCWLPDGSKLTKKIYASKRNKIPGAGNYGLRNKTPGAGDYGFMFKVDGPDDLNFSCNKIDGTTSMESSYLIKVVDAKGKELEGFEAAISDMKEGQSSTTIRLGIAAGPWTTISTHDGSGIKAGKKGVVLWSQAFETNDGTHITTSVEWREDRAERVVAIYKKDKLYTTEHDSIATGKVHQITATFKNLKLNQIKEFQYQVRPYEWATFENVSVKPGLKTDVQISFQPADKKAIPAKEDLQSLIDCANPGDTVTIPKGLYKEPVDINKPLTLKGESWAECVFEVTADRPAIFIDTKSKGEVVVEDLTIKWQLATSNKGIERPFALGVKDTKAEIKNCSFVPLGNSQRSPVAVRADGFSNLNISSSRFEGFEYVICYGQGTKGKTSDCLIMNCGHQGIINYSGATLHVERNVITGSKYHAVRCTGGILHVKDNLLINNANRGIYLGNRSGSGTINNNLIINNAVGIGAFASAKYEIQNNVIADSSYSGIGMYKSCSLTIRDNIFLNNERGWVMFDKGEKGGNTSYRNTFWKNKVDDENFSKTGNSINADPAFIDPDNGDYSLKPGPAKENKQGLTNPQLFKTLWKVWKNRKDKNVPFIK